MTGPIPLTKTYPANLWLCYRGIAYRPAALQLFVSRGGWGKADTHNKAPGFGTRGSVGVS